MTPTRRALLVGGGSLGVLALGGIGVGRMHRAASGDVQTQAVLFDPDQPVLGNPQGDVTVAEFFDYQCPFCKRGHDALMAEIAADGHVRLVMKDWPIFGGTSVTAARMVLGAHASGRYAEAQAALMATPGRLSDRDLEAALRGAGLDPQALLAAHAADRARWDGLIRRNGQQAAGLGLQGTPVFVIGPGIHPGAMDRDALRRAIAAARAVS